ncbi:hypothetical protein IQ61_28020 [Streptomyces scabiei]|nr:hypothetical protein IQ61_28020 [Streptomyces scabiei]
MRWSRCRSGLGAQSVDEQWDHTQEGGRHEHYGAPCIRSSRMEKARTEGEARPRRTVTPASFPSVADRL